LPPRTCDGGFGAGRLPSRNTRLIVRLSAADIAAVREQASVSQAVMAGYLNVGVGTISQWERGSRRPTGTALKLLHVVRAKGLGVLT
jgi:putative transcriptional regulator